MIPQGMTIKEYYERDAQRKKRRKMTAAFNAKMKGEKAQLPRTVIRAQLDHLVSLFVRRRDRGVHGGLCLVCVTKRNLGLLERAPEPIGLAYHIVPRGDDTTRWNLANVIGACSRCNDGERWSRNKASLKERYRQIHIALIGLDKLDELEKLSNQTADFSNADLIEMRDQIKLKLEGA